ncbi:MAG: class IV adenylate cyclase [archaeon]
MIETEVKHKIKNNAALRKIKLKLKKSAVFQKKEKEFNLVFDSTEGELKKKDFLLRLRKDSKNTLTFKAPAKKSKFKERNETELIVKDFNRTKRLLESMNFLPVFVYEKKREYFEFNRTEILLDELPFLGFFLELEGTEKGIMETEKMLGLKEENRITKNYLHIFLEHKKKTGLKEKNMVFSKSKL